MFEELARDETRAGTITLRRRREPALDTDVYEVKLDHEFLMSSLFTVAEIELANLGLASTSGPELVVAVGGLGLGYTAHAVLQHPRVTSMVVIEAVREVISWHERGLIPDTADLASDARTTFVHADFFELIADDGLDPNARGRKFDAVLLDIDHTPRNHLHPSHAPFYTADGLRQLQRHLRPDGTFALWSDDPPDDDFLGTLEQVFRDVAAHVVAFPNFQTGTTSSNTIYTAH